MFVLVVFVFGVTVVVCRSISSLCVKKWSISVTFYGGGRQKTLVNIYERVNTASHFASIGFGTLLRDKCHEEID